MIFFLRDLSIECDVHCFVLCLDGELFICRCIAVFVWFRL